MGRKIEVDSEPSEGMEIRRAPEKPLPTGQMVPPPPEGPSESQTSFTPKEGSPYTFGQGASTTPIGTVGTSTTQLFAFSRKVWLFIGGGLFLLWLLFSPLIRGLQRAVGPPSEPRPPVFTPWKGYIAEGPVVNLRKGAGAQNEEIGSLLVGEEVEVLSPSQDWFRIKSKRGEGYIHKNLVSRNRPILSHKDYLGRARFYLRATDYPKAMKELEQAKKLGPDSSEPYLLATKIYLAQGRGEEAMKEFLEAVKRGIEGDYPIVVNIRTSYAALRAEPKDIKSITSGIIKFKNGSKFRGEISIETK